MGGVSKWNVLRDTELSHATPEVFGPVPEVVTGLMQEDAERIWHSWNPLIWAVIKYRGYLAAAVVPTSALRPFMPSRNSTAFYAGFSPSITTLRFFFGNCGLRYWP